MKHLHSCKIIYTPGSRYDRVIQAIKDSKDPPTQTEISSDLLTMKQPNLSNVLTNLEKLGIVYTEVDGKNKLYYLDEEAYNAYRLELHFTEIAFLELKNKYAQTN